MNLLLPLLCLFLLCHSASSSAVHVVAARSRQRRRLPAWSQKVLAGGSSRALAQAVLYPVDALRTLAQTRDGRTLADVGAKALSRGCLTTSSFALAQGAIQFGIFAAWNDRVGPVVASALGAAGSCLVSVPQEVIKQRLVTGVYPSFRNAVATIYQTEGIPGFYSAWRPTVSRNVPFVITTFTTMDFMKRKLLHRHNNNHNNKKNKKKTHLTTAENLVIGMGSALVGGVVTQPIDVVKTRMMTQAASTAIPYTSALDCVVTIVKKEGFRKLYAGFGQRSVYMCGLWGITFAMNGYVNQKLAEQQQQQQKQQKQHRNNKP
ncbi:adenosylmethionine carrier 1, chloroplastic/mitochondrial [Seminavis robusta]|uniref:Adenosylmethionine carrier 1, chloroplastic/mitochondrial n=1 Tax=Seminavis robusta TaxID=568900 RepID=A0A9N8HC44_9STRA|nr:adenosylmethionine carrier 1, chloroplastic/mitochondrial [Seminavis robusta]|eukprot:Sro364_g127190.1 adenosylmethionine carrier 1, chloroplastic/mitochondrial (319) ;mRNA; r:52372-53328